MIRNECVEEEEEEEWWWRRSEDGTILPQVQPSSRQEYQWFSIVFDRLS